MDDPGWSWPAWKFGMKRDDLFTKLHDQYNTISSAIQDPEAFHHDVFEISHQASGADDFHRLMSQRKQERLQQLDDLLESASLQIISNPSLINTAQWDLAVQLFRTKSFDSLVRYFASYLPSDHPWQTNIEDGGDNGHSKLATEAVDIDSTHPDSAFPRASFSHDLNTDSLAHEGYGLHDLSLSRTSSFSESEPDPLTYPLHDDDTSQSSGPETPVSSISDIAEPYQKELLAMSNPYQSHDSHDEFSTPLSMASFELETPTPKPETHASCFLDAKPSPLQPSSVRHRSISPSRAFPLAHVTPNDTRRPQPQPQPHPQSSLRRRCRNISPAGRELRRSPREPKSRISKPLPGTIRSTPRRGRRRAQV